MHKAVHNYPTWLTTMHHGRYSYVSLALRQARAELAYATGSAVRAGDAFGGHSWTLVDTTPRLPSFFVGQPGLFLVSTGAWTVSSCFPLEGGIARATVNYFVVTPLPL